MGSILILLNFNRGNVNYRVSFWAHNSSKWVRFPTLSKKEMVLGIFSEILLGLVVMILVVYGLRGRV